MFSLRGSVGNEMKGGSMQRVITFTIMAVIAAVLFAGEIASAEPEVPKDIEWLTNDSDPVYASPDAKREALCILLSRAFP